MLLKYVHNVNANVEQHRRYLSDVVEVKLQDVVDKYRVTAYPVVPNGMETVTVPPVHPKTEAVTKQVPTYVVPATLKTLVRTFDPTKGDYDSHNWAPQEVTVTAIVDETLDTVEAAIAFYNELEHQLSQGDVIKGSVLKPQEDYTRNIRY